MGYSLGGGVALQTAIRQPEVVRKLVLVSTPFKGMAGTQNLAGQEQMGPQAAEPMKQTPMYHLYQGRPETGGLAGAAHQAGQAAQARL